MATTLKVITYNIHKGLAFGNVRFILPQIGKALARVDGDIILLQEILGEHTRKALRFINWPEETQSEFLAKHGWPYHLYGKSAIYKSGHHGNAILSRYQILEWENIDISFQKRASRSLLHVIVHFPNTQQRTHLICAHMGLFKFERRAQMKMLVERIESHVPHHEPLVIAGDFNDWRKDAEQHLEQALDLQEAFKTLTGKHAKSFPAIRPTLEVDRIYYRGLKAVHCERYDQAPWRTLSDHVPLLAEFSLGKMRVQC